MKIGMILQLMQFLVFLGAGVTDVEGANYSVVYGSWSNWSECSKSCGGGILERSRKCLNVKKCKPGSLEEQEPCNEQRCPSPEASQKKKGYTRREGKSIFLYKVTTFTSEEQEEILSMKVLLTINPDSNSQSFPLSSVDDSKFAPGETNELFFISKIDFGDIRSIRLEVIFESETFDCGWEVRKITIVNQANGYEANFIFEGSVEAGHPVVLPAILIETQPTKQEEEYEDDYVPPKTTTKPSILYHITTLTSEDQPPLAPGEVKVTINPEPQEGGSTATFKLENQHSNNFGQGETDIFFYQSEVDFGKIGSVKLEFIPSQPNYGNVLWRMRKMIITNTDTGYKLSLYYTGFIGSQNQSVTIRVGPKVSTLFPPTEQYASPKKPGNTEEQPVQTDYYPPTLKFYKTPTRTSTKILPVYPTPSKDEKKLYNEVPQTLNPQYPTNIEEEEIINEEIQEAYETNPEAYQSPPKAASYKLAVEQTKVQHPSGIKEDSYYDDDEEEIYRPNIGDTGPFLAVTREVDSSPTPVEEFEYRVTTVTSPQSSQSSGGSAYIVINPKTFSGSPKVKLFNVQGADFRPGQTDVFNFKLQTDYKDLENVEVEFDGNATPTPLWKLTEIIVLNVERGNSQRFRYDGNVGSSRQNKSVVLYPTLDGHWCNWSSFSKPPMTCLKPGHPQPTVYRLRKCSCPFPSNFGLPCEGVDKETKPANLPPCQGKARLP